MMSKTMRTFETSQPWVIYTYGLTHDLWWPPWNSTRWLGYGKIECHCSICGEREVLKLRMPRFGQIADRGHHPERVRFLSQHVHKLQQTAPETWAQPLANPDAHGDLLDILRDVAAKATTRHRATPPQET